MSGTYRDLRVWQLAMDFTEAVYHATENFPRREMYGLASQLQRAAVSVASNIAEGKGRRTDRDFCQFLFHARGSLLEAETQIEIACRLKYISREEMDRLLSMATGVGSALAGLINAVRPREAAAASN
jgi:four helix bundle protein